MGFTDACKTKGRDNVAAGLCKHEPPQSYQDEIAARIAAVSELKKQKASEGRDLVTEGIRITNDELDQVIDSVDCARTRNRIARREPPGPPKETPVPKSQPRSYEKKPSQGICPVHGPPLGGIHGTRCYTCHPGVKPKASSNGAHKPVNRVAEKLAKPPTGLPVEIAPRSGSMPAADLAAELRDLAAVVEAMKSLSPASRRWLAESLDLFTS